MDSRPIGVFDSGVGGLTIVRGLIELMPDEEILYFGDTARYPYGPRSRDEVRRFAMEIATWLAEQDVKMLVAACNSAASAGLDHVRDAFPDLHVVEVVEPAVRAAIRATRNRRIGVIGTELTIASGAYQRALDATKENVMLFSQACPRFVEFVERGETAGPEIIELAREYLAPLQQEDVDTLILGCTHYPLLQGVLHFVMRDAVLISSAEETAQDVYTELTQRNQFRVADTLPRHRFVSSGDAVTFQALGSRFLGPEIAVVEERSLGPVS
ncbi:MAG TPA: glutamate racemase [Actinomycetota bacterium]|nr:glutamate racemase [Actinomycetota bacterium]